MLDAAETWMNGRYLAFTANWGNWDENGCITINADPSARVVTVCYFIADIWYI